MARRIHRPTLSPRWLRVILTAALACAALFTLTGHLTRSTTAVPPSSHSDALPAVATAQPAPTSVFSPAPAADFSAALIAATHQSPAHAIALATELTARHPASARDFGYAAIDALQHAGAFTVAADYATTSPPAIRRDLVIACFHAWARQSPEDAWSHSIKIPDPASREIALQSVLSGWARQNPEDLATTALQFPEGAEKSAALTKALRAWMIKDPWKAGDWILANQAALPVAEKMFADENR